MTVVADEVFALVGDVLSQFGQEVEWLEDLKVAGYAAQQVHACGLGKTLRMMFLRPVNDLPGGGDADEAGQAERAANHVLGQTLDALPVAGLEAGASVNVEAAVPPGSNLYYHGRPDLVLVQEQAEDLVLPEAKERLVAEVFGQGDESAVGGEGAVGYKAVDVWVEMDELAEGLDGQHAARVGIFAQDGPIHLQERLPSQSGKPMEQAAVEAEEDAEAFRDGPDKLAMGHV